MASAVTKVNGSIAAWLSPAPAIWRPPVEAWCRPRLLLWYFT